MATPRHFLSYLTWVLSEEDTVDFFLPSLKCWTTRPSLAHIKQAFCPRAMFPVLCFM